MESGRPKWPRFEIMETIRIGKGRKCHEGEEQEMREDQGMERVTLQSRGPRCDAELVRCVDMHC